MPCYKLLLFAFIGCSMLNINSCISENVSVTIIVQTPPSTPADALIYISGNHKLVGDWNPGQIKLEKQSDNSWTIILKLHKELFFEFKITRGSWSTQAIYNEGEIPPNNSLFVKSDTTLTLEPLSWQDINFKLSGRIEGVVKYHKDLIGEGLNHPRDLIVWLPPSYETDMLKRYPVLYMHDGQNVFDPATSFIGYDWHVDEVADSLIRVEKIQEMIVVGVYNTPDRGDEYSDTKLGRAYMKFLVEKVKPLIDTTYRTLPDRANTSTMGSSMGGLISFLLVWNYSDIFSQAGCISPVFRDILTKALENYKGPDKQIRIYIDNGGVGLDKELQPGCDKMLISLKAIGYSIGKNLEWYLDESAEHNEHAWAARVWRPLLFMYEKNK
ncbi:MAG: histidine kinase [Chlorobiaceae bacterium]|nr:histidine kinase [Chlorobiaceae bacterium]